MENTSNFEKGCDFFENNYSQKELYNFLKSGSEMEKQLACLQLENATMQDEADILISNLTGVDGKIREAVSYKLKCFMRDEKKLPLFRQVKYYDVFLDAIIDINGNICRNVISAVSNLKSDKNFAEYFKSEIFKRANDVLEIIEKFTYKDKKYKTNKELFKLYWYLETLSIFDFDDTGELFELLKKCSELEEYTVREKTAFLMCKLSSAEREKLKQISDDKNPYVLRALSN